MKVQLLFRRSALNKNKFLDTVGATAAVVGIGLAVIGFFQELASFLETEGSKPEHKPGWQNEPDLSHLAQKGWSLLEQKHDGEQTLDTYLGQKYLGLYLIGRAKTRVPNDRREAIAHDLRHFHHQLDRQTDWALVEWYETIGVSKSIPLSKLLRVCPEVIALEIDPRYIAFAFGEEVEISVLDSLIDIESLKKRGLL
jgi:hypothetical protein